MRDPNRNDWIKLPGLFLCEELQRGGIPIDPLFEYLILPHSDAHRGQPVFAVYFRSRRSNMEPN